MKRLEKRLVNEWRIERGPNEEVEVWFGTIRIDDAVLNAIDETLKANMPGVSGPSSRFIYERVVEELLEKEARRFKNRIKRLFRR